MTISELWTLIEDGHAPASAIVQTIRAFHTIWWYAWTPTWEGPARRDYMAARADLVDHQNASSTSEI